MLQCKTNTSYASMSHGDRERCNKRSKTGIIKLINELFSDAPINVGFFHPKIYLIFYVLV